MIPTVPSNDNQTLIDKYDNDKIKGADFFSNLNYEFSNDILYKILKKSDRHNSILTDSLKKDLKDGVLYSTPKAAKILDIHSNTLRGWILELQDYVIIQEQGRYIKLDYRAVYRLRMIQLLRENNEYSVNKIKELTLGVEIINPSDNEESHISLNEKVELILEDNEELKFTIDTMSKQMTQMKFIMDALIDKDALKNNQIKLKSEVAVSLLSDPNTEKKFENLINEYKEDNEKQISDLKTDINKNIDYRMEETTKKFASVSREEAKKIFQEQYKKPSLLNKVLFWKRK